MSIDATSSIDQRDDTRHSERDVDHTLAPWPTKTVADHDAGRGLWELGAQARGRRIAILRQQQDSVLVTRHVRTIYTCVGHNEACAMSRDQSIGRRPHDLAGLAQHRFDKSRLFADDARNFDGARRGTQAAQIKKSILRFRDDLLRDDEHVTRLQFDFVST